MELTLNELDIIIESLRDKRISICDRQEHHNVFLIQKKFHEERKAILNAEYGLLDKTKCSCPKFTDDVYLVNIKDLDQE